MSDPLLGRTFNTRGGGDAPPPGSSFNTLANSTITNEAHGQRDVSQLYTMVETTMMNLPTQEGGAELKPNELARQREMLSETWELIREWLAATPSASDRQQAAQHQGQFLSTALHNVCKLDNPPVDVVQSLMDCSPETITWQDSNGWLPLHHACANGGSGQVIRVLVDAYPMGKVTQDKRLRTPLHFAFFRKDAQKSIDAANTHTNDDLDDVESSMAEIVSILGDSGAAELPDEGGMLPIHYASAYGTSEEVLHVLMDNYPQSIAVRENKGRTPLHMAMVNAHRKSSPKVVGFLLNSKHVIHGDVVNVCDDDNHLPIHLLAMASKLPPERVVARQNASECLLIYLDAKPKATADFLTAIQTLPEWLRDKAVISNHIQDILNQKIVMRFPTMILILDLVFLLIVIVCFELSTGASIDDFFTRDSTDDVVEEPQDGFLLILIFTGGAYFLLRELIQVISLIALGNLSSWFWDPTNWLDVMSIFSMFYFGAIMWSEDPVDKNLFRSGVAVAKGVYWLSVIIYLKSINVEFSVFVSGVFYVGQRLVVFMFALFNILLMFAQMFLIVYRKTSLCKCNEDNLDAEPFPHCEFGRSLLKVYTMLMGEIGNEFRYSTSLIAQILYMLFAFLVVILLSNVLIAIVTDSYGVIKNERSAMVFWSNRLDFVAEMDAISSIFSNIKRMVFKNDSSGVPGAPMRVQENPSGEATALEDPKKSNGPFRNGWVYIMALFDPNLLESYDVTPFSFEFWCYFLVRFGAIVFVIPLWIVIGFASAGWLWPPQVREMLFFQKKAAISRADMAEQVSEKINELKDEIKVHRLELKSEIKSDRREFAIVRSEIDAVQAEVMADLMQVKEIMSTLLDMTRDKLERS